MTNTPTTGGEIVAAQPATGLGERIKYAQALASASLLPKAYQKQPANVLLAMEYGQALGLDTITAIQSVHVIDGKPTASAQLIGGLVRRAGHRLRVTGDDQKAVAEVIRCDDPEFVFRSEWTMARAQAAGLTGKGVWKQYPAAMLKARAITEVARDACPEALAGVAYTPEELGSSDHAVWEAPKTAVEAPVAAELIEEGEVVDDLFGSLVEAIASATTLAELHDVADVIKGNADLTDEQKGILRDSYTAALATVAKEPDLQ